MLISLILLPLDECKVNEVLCQGSYFLEKDQSHLTGVGRVDVGRSSQLETKLFL
jgi:hypothetical protein